MKKFVVKPQGTLSFRPHVETLECRAQPGSVLGSSLLGAVALDLNADLGRTQRAEQDTVSELRLTHDNDLTLHVNYQQSSQRGETAPVQFAAVSSAPVQASTNNGLSIQDQARSVAAHSAQSATVTHPAVTLGGGGVSSQVRLSNQGQTQTQSQNNGNNYQASALAISAQGIATGRATLSSQAVHATSFGDLTGRAFSVNADHVPPPAVNPVYVSYMIGLNSDGSAAGASSINGVRFNPTGDGSLFIAGSATDPSTGLLDGFVAQVSADGSSLVGRTLSSSTANVVANGVDISPNDGSIYVAGTISLPDGSASSDFLARVEGDVQTLDWISQLTIGGTLDSYNGVRDAFDPAVGQEAVYVTGSFQSPSTGLQDTAVLELINLNAANPPDPANGDVLGGAFVLPSPDQSGADGNSYGNGIGVDSNGSAFVAFKLALPDNSDSTAGILAFNISANQGRFTFLLLSTTGPTNGSMTSVGVNLTTNNAYLTGTFGNDLDGNPRTDGATNHQSLIATAWNFDPVNNVLTSVYTSQGQTAIWVWSAGFGTPRMDVDWFATGNAPIPATGDQAMNAFVNDPTSPGGSLLVFRVGPNGDASLDTAFQFVPTGGSADDESTGMDIAPDPLGGNDYAQGGFTASTDFLTLGTPAPFQATDPDATGSTNQGWVSVNEFTPL